MMKIGIPSEIKSLDGLERRVALTPANIKKFNKLGLKVVVESGAGLGANSDDDSYRAAGIEVASRQEAFGCDIVLKLTLPQKDEISMMSEGSTLVGMIDPHGLGDLIDELNKKKINAFSMELLPRTSRAQSMDILSSQANIAGYRAVLEATQHFKRFLPMMMTSAGIAKPAKFIVLGAGVAGLQAIATAKRLGASVEAYDIRPEVKEQIESLGAKFIELEVEEVGSGEGGYAKELTDEAKKKQQSLLTEYLKTADIIVTTANIPGRKAPILITEEAARGMKRGSVIVDLAAPTGGNCPLTKVNEVYEVDGVTLVGTSNYPSLMASDASLFLGNNFANFLALMVTNVDGLTKMNVDFEDDILKGACVAFEGETLLGKNK